MAILSGFILDIARGPLRDDVRLGESVTLETVPETAPDAIVVAAGSIPVVPAIPGIEGTNVVQARVLADVKSDRISMVVLNARGL
jgi:hypothetical protein